MKRNRPRMNERAGFTLIELVIIIVVLGIVAAVAVPRFADMTDSSREAATRQEMQSLRRAVTGNAQVVAGGRHIDRGFEGDIGFPPASLVDLISKPDSIAVYDRLTRLGWNGPYIDSSQDNYLTDAWGAAYIYSSSLRHLKSVGGEDTITVTF